MKQSAARPSRAEGRAGAACLKPARNRGCVGFPGGGERIAALLGGHVDLMIAEPSEAAELVRAGKVRAVAPPIAGKRLAGSRCPR